MAQIIRPKHMFAYLRNGAVHSFCDSGCCAETIEVQNGDTIERDFGSGFLLKLDDGTFVRTHKFTIYRLPKKKLGN